MTQYDVVITAGGTKEAIDDVRYITNFSTGEFGHTLAAEFSRRGRRVLLLAPKEVIQRFGLPGRLTHQSFTDANSLQHRLLSIDSAGLVLHAAAVADYTPERVTGKISSDQNELTLRLKRTQKILPLLRGHYGVDTTIVGFKLLSNVPESELIKVAIDQIQKAKTDYCIANDLRYHGENRVVHLVSDNGEFQTLSGGVGLIAKSLVELINK